MVLRGLQWTLKVASLLTRADLLKHPIPLMHSINIPCEHTGIVYIADGGNGLIRKIVSSFDYPTSQPSAQPSIPTSQPTVQVKVVPS